MTVCSRIQIGTALYGLLVVSACGFPETSLPRTLYISESNYELACSLDSDCAVVNGGLPEDLCNTNCATSSHMSIAGSSLAAYQNDLSAIVCRVKLTVDTCTDRKAKPVCNNSRKCDRKY
jgi:hypothetical protein